MASVILPFIQISNNMNANGWLAIPRGSQGLANYFCTTSLSTACLVCNPSVSDVEGSGCLVASQHALCGCA